MKRHHHRVLALSILGALALSAAAWGHNDDKMKMDSNGDGMISAAEHAAGAQAMFARMDTDHDGNVSAAEMDAGHRMAGDESMHGKAMSSADRIAKMDSNGDGMLSAAEHAAGAQAMFRKMDGNGDGNVSGDEMQAGHAAMKADMDKGMSDMDDDDAMGSDDATGNDSSIDDDAGDTTDNPVDDNR